MYYLKTNWILKFKLHLHIRKFEIISTLDTIHRFSQGISSQSYILGYSQDRGAEDATELLQIATHFIFKPKSISHQILGREDIEAKKKKKISTDMEEHN